MCQIWRIFKEKWFIFIIAEKQLILHTKYTIQMWDIYFLIINLILQLFLNIYFLKN